LPGVDDALLDPRKSYDDAGEWARRADELAEKFVSNFEQYTDNAQGASLVTAGPQRS